MQLKKRFTISIAVVVILLLGKLVFAEMPNLKLPFEGGLTWQVSGDYDIPTHKDWGLWVDDDYALDFTDAGCGSWDKPALAVAGGTILTADNVDDSAYGKQVVIDHGYGYRSRYAHLNSVSVRVGEKVVQGQEIGRVGNTGNSIGTACEAHGGTHLHFALYKDGATCKPEPMSGYTNFVDGNSYTSDNYDGTVTDLSVCSSTVYLASNGKLWPILNEKVYTLLGYGTSACSLTPDWSHIISALDSEKSNYTIRQEPIPSENNAATGRMIAYRVVPKVGPTSCMTADIDSTRIYLFEGGKFCHIANEVVYGELFDQFNIFT